MHRVIKLGKQDNQISNFFKKTILANNYLSYGEMAIVIDNDPDQLLI